MVRPFALLGFVACVALGCGSASTAIERPAATLVSYAQAVRDNDAEAAYALLDDEVREDVSLEDVERLMNENRAELADQAAEVRALAGDVEAEATVTLESGETVRLVLENGEWAIDGNVLGAPALRTPRDTVLALRRALQRRSLAGVERVLARQPRAEIAAEIERIVEETADELDLDVEMRGNRAVVKTTGGREIELVREAGEWKIVAIH
jgi:hypothetical protein